MVVDRSMKEAERSLVYSRHSILVSKVSLTDALSNGTLVVASSYFVLKFMVHHYLFMCACGMYITVSHTYNTKFNFPVKHMDFWWS